MTTPEPAAGSAAALRLKLADELTASGDLRTQPWRTAIETVPREVFIPAFFERIDAPDQTMWRPITPELVAQRVRLELTYTDETWVTQLNHHTRVGGHEKLPGDGHEAARWRTENCPLMVMGSARHDVVCLAGSTG